LIQISLIQPGETQDPTIVCIDTDAGICGWGEGCPWGVTYLPAFGKGVRAGIDEIAPQLLGLDPRRLDVVDRAMDLSIEPIPIQRPLAAVMGAGLIGLIGAAVIQARDALVINPGDGLAVAGENAQNDGNIQQLAENLYGDHVFAFELTSVLLIVAVAGTVLMTRKWPKRDAEAEAEAHAESDS